MNMTLCGMMGAGKTTVGKQVAKLVGWRWVDTDEAITQRYGDIKDIFASRGEEYFRRLETGIVKELVQEDGLVISVGGGLVLLEENVSMLQSNGKIVYLRASIETLMERLGSDTERPLLQTKDFEKRLQNLLADRTPIYESAADFTVDVDGKTVDKLAEEIVALVQDIGENG